MRVNNIIVLLTVSLLSVLPVSAQYSEHYSSSQTLFSEGVELYMQGKWAASERALKAYHGKTYQTQAEFYLAANAYEIRRKDARRLLQAYLKQNTYTPYASEVHFMLGTLLVEQNKKMRYNNI